MRKLLILTSTTFFSVNAHLGHRVTFPHIKVYTCGSRNRIAILDSDKILICLRNALLFLGSIIRTKRGRFFLLNTQNVFLYEIMDEMANLIQDSQWKIGAFLKSPSKKNIRSRTNKITLGFHQKPDCVLILDADRKSSVIVEADRSQIPIVSLVDSTTPLRSFQRITYPIPANNSIQFVYLFANLLAKQRLGKRDFSSSAKKAESSLKSSFFKGKKGLLFFFTLMSCTLAALFVFIFYFSDDVELISELLANLASYTILFFRQLFLKEQTLTLGGKDEAKISSAIVIHPMINREEGPAHQNEPSLDLNMPADTKGQEAFRDCVRYMTDILKGLRIKERDSLIPDYDGIQPITDPTIQNKIRAFFSQRSCDSLPSDLSSLGVLRKKSPLLMEFREFLLKQKNRP